MFLSERERSIIKLVAEGLLDKEIAQRLHISARTVQTHLGRIYAKNGAANKAQAVALFFKTEILPNYADAIFNDNPTLIS